MNKRTDALAARLEQRAIALAAYAEWLTAQQWAAPVKGRRCAVKQRTCHKAAAIMLIWLWLFSLVGAGCTPIQPRADREPAMTQSPDMTAQAIATEAACNLLTTRAANLISGEPITDVMDRTGNLCGYGGVGQTVDGQGDLLALEATYGVALGVYPQPLVHHLFLRMADAMRVHTPEVDQEAYEQIAKLANADMTLLEMGQVYGLLYKLVRNSNRWNVLPLAPLRVPGNFYSLTEEMGQQTMMLIATNSQKDTLLIVAHRRNGQDSFDSLEAMVAIAYTFANGEAGKVQK